MEELLTLLKMFWGGYFGVMEMDEYVLKTYVAQDVVEYLNIFVKENKISMENNLKMKEEASEENLETKLNDALLTLNRINSSLELELLIKKRLKRIQEK